MRVRGVLVRGGLLGGLLLLVGCGTDGDDGGSGSAVTTTVVSSTSAGGGGGGFGEVVAAAEEEGTVFFAGSGADWAALEAAFEAAYPGIDLQTTVVTTGEALARLDQERDLVESGTPVRGTDVVFHTSPLWFQEAAADGALLAVEPSAEVVELWEGIAQFEESEFFKVVNFFAYAFAWNTDLFDGEISSIDDVLDPALAGQVGGIDAHAAPIVARFYELFVEDDPEFISRFAALDPKFSPNGSTAAQDLAAGEYAVGVGMIPASILPLIEAGAPLDYHLAPDTLLGPYAAGIVEWAAHPNAAQVFMDWLLSAEGQQVLTDSIRGTTGLPGISVQLAGATGSGNLDAYNIYDESDWRPEDNEAFLAQWDAGINQ